jgi:heptosyltransferase-2
MVWHLPHIRALAAQFGGTVTLLAKPRSAADQIFAAEGTVADVLWLDRNPERRRGAHDGASGFLRLVAALRRRRFRRVVLLHHSRTLAMACLAAGIPERYGYGAPLQRPFLNRPPSLSASALRLHPFEQAGAWLKAAGIPLAETEPRLPVAETARQLVRARLGSRPFAVLGIGSSEPYKQWGAERFAALAAGLARAGFPRLVLAGGPAERGVAAEIAVRAEGTGADLLALGRDRGALRRGGVLRRQRHRGDEPGGGCRHPHLRAFRRGAAVRARQPDRAGAAARWEAGQGGRNGADHAGGGAGGDRGGSAGVEG